MKKLGLSFAIILSTFLAASVSAQESSNRGAVESDCNESSCQRVFLREVRDLKLLGLPEEEFNSRLGQIASDLFERAKEEENLRVSKQVSAALVQLAKFSTDEQQSESFVLIARIIREGDVDLFEIDDPFAVSPS